MATLIEEFKEATETALNNNRLSHAYLIEINTTDDNIAIMEFAKKILNLSVPESEQEKNNHLVDIGNHPDFKIIKTEGSWVKKEQILNLQAEFTNKSIYNGKRVYIIEEAEKLNKSSANTLLKFLEEPNSNIIGILITRNKYIVIDTIISRCQYFNISSTTTRKIEKDKDYVENIIKFAKLIENKKEKSVAYYSEIDREIFTSRIEIREFLSDLLLLYNDVLYVMIKKEPLYFYDYKEDLEKISEYNNNDSIIRKVTALNKCIDDLKYNVNLKLLMDKLNILMSGCELNV
jgi:DNA polymerase III, gamma/tau subunits